MEHFVLYDGECNFCSGSVQFIIKRDSKSVFKFAPLKGETGKRLLAVYGLSQDSDSFVLIAGERAYVKSTAALRIAKELRGLWKLSYLLIIIPRPLRDFFYDKFAANRYRWFGNNECRLPSPKERKRFYF